MSEPAAPEITIVIPVYNERDSLGSLLEQLRAARRAIPPSEIVFVDDGSRDGSAHVLEAAHQADPSIRVVRFTRNFGQTAALAAGFDYARGSVIVTMDADLQNDPADIATMLAKLDEGYDVVSGWRVDRKDTLWTRRLPSIVANRMISRLSRVRLHDYGCTLKAYRRDVVEGLELYGDAHRFLPALASRVGDRVAEVPVTHRPRIHGESKYGLGRVGKVFLDMLALPFMLRFFNRPIRFFGTAGMLMGLAGSGLLVWMGVERFGLGHPIGGRPALLIGMLLVLAGVQLVTLGLLGEAMTRAYYAGRGRHPYTVRRALVSCTPGRHTCSAPAPPSQIKLP
ncbi:MAG TPA: glycosyltransferase family 2 protein [Actinomycetota bacterium]